MSAAGIVDDSLHAVTEVAHSEVEGCHEGKQRKDAKPSADLARYRAKVSLTQQPAHCEAADEHIHGTDEAHLCGGSDEAKGVYLHQQRGVQHDLDDEAGQYVGQRGFAVRVVGLPRKPVALAESAEIFTVFPDSFFQSGESAAPFVHLALEGELRVLLHLANAMS